MKFNLFENRPKSKAFGYLSHWTSEREEKKMHFMITSVLPLLLILNLANCWQVRVKVPTDANVTEGRCVRPKRPSHGFHDGYRRFPSEALIPAGEHIHYQCHTNRYDLVGNGTRTCLKDGTWSGKEPWCNLTSCSDDDHYSPENGRTVFGQSVKFGSKIRFECNPGYKIIGPREAVCLNNGLWSGRRPWCKSFCRFLKCPSGQKCVINKMNLHVKCICKNILECPFEYKPICGSDGVTYASRCVMGMVACSQNRPIKEVSNGSCPKVKFSGHQEVEYCSPCTKIQICPAFWKGEYGFIGKVIKKNETSIGTFLHFLVEDIYKGHAMLSKGRMMTVFMKTSNSKNKCSCVPRLPDGKLYVFGKSGVLPSGIKLPFFDERTYVERFYSHKQLNLCWLY